MSSRLRPSIFPCFAPYLNFVGPDEEYQDEDDLDIEFTVARGTGKVIMDFLHKFGFKIIEVCNSNVLRCCDHCDLNISVDITRPYYCAGSSVGPPAGDKQGHHDGLQHG